MPTTVKRAILESSSIIRKHNDTQETSYRQRLIETPAGKLVIQKEKEIEKELVDLSTKCTFLENSLVVEKAMVEALSARQGALGKINAVRETSLFKSELERKTNDLQAIIWKMNELHLVNKTIDEKVDNREHHVSYLEEQVVDLQNQNRRLYTEKVEAEKKMREENSALQKELDGASIRLWQLGDKMEANTPKCRILVPSNGKPFDATKEDSPQRRVSLGNISVEDITLLDPPGMNSMSTTSTQTEDVSTSDSFTQTENETLSDASIQTDEQSRMDSASVEVAIQTEGEEKESAAETCEMSTQTEGSVRGDVPTVDASSQTLMEATHEISMQTEDNENVEAVVIPSLSNVSTQTTDDDPSWATNKVPSAEVAIQTDTAEIQLTDIPTQTIQLPEEISLGGSKSIDAASLDLGDDDSHTAAGSASRLLSDKRKPPKPTKSIDGQRSSVSASASASIGSDTSPHGSNTSLDFHKAFGMEDKLGSSMRWGSPPSPAKNVHDRLGSSMSVLQNPPGKVSALRAVKNSRKPPPRKKSASSTGSNDCSRVLE